MISVCACVSAYAQTDTIRYVRADGDFSNDGRSWATAKNRVQDAINDLRDYLHANNLTSGSVYIAAGTYSPTESTEAAGGSMLHTAFKIYGGIHVYGGFNPTSPESHPSLRQMVNNKLVKDNWARMDGGTVSGDDIASQWDFKYKTILDGNHSPSSVVFAYDSIRGRYNVTFPASSYHVVWFATNGKYETANDSVASHFKPLDSPASLDGCVIRNGNASSRSTTIREHTAYGGGVYMVGNSELRNCTVEKCNATMRGGGVYLDGGGTVEFCYIHTCQSPGVGVVQGYGGGACIDYEGSVGHSHITNCAARCGGGLVIGHIPSEYPVDRGISFYSPFATACVINNNTAAAEAGAIYLAEGGVINHCTVTANNCIGPDVTYYGRRHGRSGGIYIRDCGMIYNSVFWGNKCATNNDIQFASVRQVADTTGHKIFVYHTAFMNHDISDWTGVQKEVVFSLDKHNLPQKGSSNNFPCFFAPTVAPDNWTVDTLPGAGVFKKLVAEDKLDSIPGPRIWHLTSYSALDQKGVQVTDAIQGVSEWILHAHTDYGVVTNPFRPVSTLGALVRRSDPTTYALIPPQGTEGRAGGAAIPTIFIDPGRKGVFDAEGKFVYQDKEGYSWDHPIRDIGEAIQFFRQYLVDDPGGTHHYKMPKLDANGFLTTEDTTFNYVQILVKEGTINTAGPGNYLDKNIRTAAVRVESHMRLYGGYPTRLEGTDTGTRNPRDYVTTITANVTGIGGTRGYENNSAHVIAMVNVEHAIVDGFTLADANTHNILYSHSAPAGGGVLVNNVSVAPEKRIDMTGNQLRNCVITNCSSPKGAAVYVNGEHKHADGTVCYAELKMVNCVIRNNMADYQGEGGTINDHGIITANGRAYIEVEHCDVVNNVGYPFKADSKQTESDDPITCSHPEHSYHSFHGFIRVNNSLIFCNGDRPLDNRGNLGTTAKVMSVFPDGQRYVFGEYNMFDKDLRLQVDSGEVCPRGFFEPAFSYTVPADFLPAGSSFGSSLNASLPSEKNNQAIFTRTNSKDTSYPGFVNPSRNVGVSITGDKPLYGGTVSYAPLNTNPCVNAAFVPAYDNFKYDRTDNILRNRGGAPDIGAIENTNLPEAGTVLYVTPDGAGKRDGSSWSNAIAGNTIYALNGAGAAGTDQLDATNGTTRIINLNPSIGTGDDHGVLTTDNRYEGGYTKPFVWKKTTASKNSTINTYSITTNKHYSGGPRNGETDPIPSTMSDTTSGSVGTATAVSDFAIGWYYNESYPYGELSRASGYMWHSAGNSSPMPIDWYIGNAKKAFNSSTTYVDIYGRSYTGSGSGKRADIVAAGLTILDERTENYVSGLQWAVEEAARRNHVATRRTGESFDTLVQVWVGAGTYTDYKGFVMRDSVTVLGGFPTSIYSAPGLEERQALMTATVNIPKPPQNADLNAADYETILQISDINPVGSNNTFNTAAVKWRDDDYKMAEVVDVQTIHPINRTIEQYWVWDDGVNDYVLSSEDSPVDIPEVEYTNNDTTYTLTADATSPKRGAPARGSYPATKDYTRTFRRAVLSMPDRTMPTWSNTRLGSPEAEDNDYSGDEECESLAHCDRYVDLTYRTATQGSGVAAINDTNYISYHNVIWDGFTIRHGYIYRYGSNHVGGAGVRMFEGATLANCIVTNNFNTSRRTKGGGIFCDGASSTVQNCFILNNVSRTPSQRAYAGGMFMYHGTCFNTLITNNYSNDRGGALAMCAGYFYNNTVVNNTAGKNGGGLAIANYNSKGQLFMANTIIYGNTKEAIYSEKGGKIYPFVHCYIQSASALSNSSDLPIIDGLSKGIGNQWYSNQAVSETLNPFGLTWNQAKATNNYALNLDRYCVNHGYEDFSEALQLIIDLNNSMKANATEMKGRIDRDNVHLPDKDVVYAKRIQDCQVDIGAYEFNAAFAIRPDTTTHPGQAIFYVMFDSPGGDASADSPANAACAQKLQQVLDAAGRYKHKLMTDPAYNLVDPDPKADHPDKSWTVEVWLEGDNTNCTLSELYAAWYTPTRSTKHDIATIDDNPLDYSFIVPHGVQVKGGYTSQFYHYEDAAGNEVEAGTPGATVVDERDPLSYRSVLSGKITSNTGAEGNCYHVVTFTNDLFGLNEKKMDAGDQLAPFSSLEDAENHRAVLDGLFIEDGYADSPDDEDRIGAGAVVTGYAHIRNCVVKNNTAGNYGGGLYLKPRALVSGTIIKKNTADVGGGIYIEAPAGAVADSLAHIFTTTICENSANTTAGGMWFYETNARVNSSVLWHNRANDFANVSGTFTRADDNTDYPFIYCGVESRRLEGLGNIELSPSETEGVRWDQADPFRAILYYPIEMSSTLSRSGMTYAEWANARTKYPTLETADIAGISRTQWEIPGINRGYSWTDTLVVKNNDFIEMGARALNKSFEVDVDETYIMRRLYVMHTDLLNSEAARALQDNTLNNDTANMYRQMGSCTLNPFHRLGDAFDYIIAARKADAAKYRNARFEVYVEKGTYFPYHNAYGEQDEVRTNTFLIPEGTTVIGGINSQKPGHNYGQAGYIDKFTNTKIGDGSNVTVNVRKLDGTTTSYTINYALADSIRMRNENHRSMSDYNLNSIIEPWELERQTILSGNVVSGEDFTHVYHVVTVHADSAKIGPQPLRYKKANPNANWEGGTPIFSEPIAMNKPEDFDKECDLSVSARSIILDGITITGGYANHVDTSDINRHKYHAKTYFRGGGIFIDGNWTESFETGHAIPNVTDPAKHNIPVIVRNCMFSDNMAGNGGAIYSNGNLHVYSSHFTQNYSQGPMAPEDTLYIPWSAGGCIAANSYCGIVNVLFDNNEAKRGLYPIKVKGPDEIPNADARQGFGGVLSIADNARLRAANCHFMRNKAVAYSAVYNFLPNNEYEYADDKQYVFNSIFWGNEVFDVTGLDKLPYKEKPSQAAIDSFEIKYKPSRAGVFHYDGDEWDKYEKLYQEYDSLYKLYTTPTDDPRYLNPLTGYPDTFNINVIDKLTELRAQGDKIEGLYFCSYRRTYGPSSMRPDKEGYLLTQAEQRAYKDSRALKVPLKPNAAGDKVEDYDNLFSYVKGNNNVLINRVNTAADGPNFKQPSFVAGIDGYMQNADWLLTRINITTDQGWGHLKQNVTRPILHYITKYTGAEQFETREAALLAAKAENSDATDHDVYPVQGAPAASFDGVEQPDTAMFNFLAARAVARFGDTATPYIPIGRDQYMTYSRTSGEETVSGEMYRISPNPKLRVEDVYIDMGVYEYQYVQLDLNGNEVDTVWVATTQKGLKHDGLTWETPTTDLQAAIDLLMSSHNNHDKYVCFLGDPDQSFAPTNVIDNRRAFVLSSNAIAPLLPDSAYADTDYAVKSISFLGGYSYDVKDAPRDPQANPTTIEMLNLGHQSQLNQLFVINDMTRIHLQANWMGEMTTRDKVAIPVVFDGLTFINPYSVKDQEADSSTNIGGMVNMRGGAAIYYRWQRLYETQDEGGEGVFTPNFNKALRPDSAEVDGKKIALPKLTISNCIFKDNGARTDDKKARSSAVRIDQGGGSSLIVNSLFHSNAGAPVYAKRYDVVIGENDLATVPNDVVVMNSTFALNDGHITLLSDSSRVHNSLIWLDDLANDTLTQLEFYNDNKWDKNTNKSKPGIANRMTRNAVWGCFVDGDDTYHNDNLVSLNSDVFEGPCFTDPNPSAATAEERRARDFHINPGIRTMNLADTTLYRKHVFYRVYPDTCDATDGKFWRRSNGFKSVPVYRLANDSDLAAKPRVYGEGMERGAYECLAVLQRVLYVQPDMPAATAGDGSSWLSPFGQGQLQNAIDAAALYTYLNKEVGNPETRKSYVFVKGSYEATDEYHIVARDGVNVYGSIPAGFNDTAWLDTVAKQYTNEGCRHYVNYVRAKVTGVASPNATPTRIASVSTASGAEYETGFLLDGFVITNPKKTLTESPVVLDKEHAVVRNCIFTDNKTDGVPVADIQKGLVYNSLFYADTAATVLRLGANGLALNNTVLTAQTTDTPIDFSATTADASVNNIAGHTADLHCFAPYLTDGNVYTLPAYQTSYPTLAYQLHERSREINAGVEMDNLPAAFNSYKTDSTVCFGLDRDILGNPRRITTVDRGALETWRIEPKTVVEITARTEVIRTAEEIGTAHAEHRLTTAFTSHYGGHQYPHPGSVVYLMDSSAITMQYKEEDFIDFNGDSIILRPGYMLLKPGASFYGNGHTVQLNYLAAEKRFVNQRYSMTALPYGYSVENVIATTYKPSSDILEQTLNPLPTRWYLYSGAARSEKDYTFRTDNSSLWLPVDTLNRTATQGYLMDFGTTQDTVLRFTAFAPALGQYVYTEDTDDKYVFLTQYDYRIAGTGNDLNFTRQEDMGWNMKGLPWLVSNYRTDTILEEGNYLRQMYIPHVFYQMDGAGNYLTSGDQMYTSRSWDKGATMAMGNAFFTQTATTKDKETLVFHLPYYDRNEKASRPILRMVSRPATPTPSPMPAHAPVSTSLEGRSGGVSVLSDFLTAIPDAAARKDVRYNYGRDGIKWSTNTATPQLYMMDAARTSRISLLGAAPTEVDIPLGVYIPQNDQMVNGQMVLDFSLPEKEAFAGYEYVWLIDYRLNRFTNLQEEDYTVELEPGETNDRFAFRIGGFPKTDKDGARQYVVYSYEGSLFVRGLVAGDRITVYSASGKLIHQAVASGYEYTTPLTYQNGYIVKVNDRAHKVLNLAR